MPDERFMKIVELAKRRGFFWRSYEIYGGMAGLYDYGHYGALMKDNLIEMLKDYYVNKLGFVMIDTPNLGAEEVYIASGHVEKFGDYIVECEKCGLMKAEDVLGYVPKSEDELKDLRCPKCSSPLIPKGVFSLMFKTNYGPYMERIAYLRPETAQGIFVNFDKLYRLAREKIPFGVVQVGKGFRNEISPRNALLRMREFNMFEVEVFLDDKRKWNLDEEVLRCTLYLIPKNGAVRLMSIGNALKEGIIGSEAMAFFMYSTYKLLLSAGIPEKAIRFRQHREDELAHYANDCWDCEVRFGEDWVEVVGIADRGDYDLKRHSDYSGKDLRILKELGEKRKVKKKVVKANMKVLGPIFRERAREAAKIIENSDGNIKEVFGVELPENAFRVEIVEEEISHEKFYPVVIEPSYGVDRIIFGILYNSYYEREEGYRVLRLPPKIAPVKAGVFPLVNRDSLPEIAMKIKKKLSEEGIICYYDDSGSIGRRYARADEVGVPFCITVDYQSKEDSTVTIRERDSTEQKRVRIDSLPEILKKLCEEKIKFDDL